MTENVVNRSVLRRLSEVWSARAAVRGQWDGVEQVLPYDHAVPDYPTDIVPFARHPLFEAATPEKRDQVLTLLWLTYNERVIATEKHIAEPAFALIMDGRFPGSDEPEVRQTVQQALVDESYHTYMHMMAIERTSELRGIRAQGEAVPIVTHRRLLAALDGLPERWERDVYALAWGAVAETSINAYLALISRDDTIQPLHSLITGLHLRDESAHGSVVVEVLKRIYPKMSHREQESFATALPLALEAFAAQDLSSFQRALHQAGIAGADEIIGDMRSTPSGTRLLRDFSGARRIVRELELTDRVEFDFPPIPDWVDEAPVVPAWLATKDEAGARR